MRAGGWVGGMLSGLDLLQGSIDTLSNRVHETFFLQAFLPDLLRDAEW